MDHFFIRNLLFETMDQILDRREEFLFKPEHSFVRNRLISFRKALTFPMVIGKGDLEEETRHFFPKDKCATLSAMIQQRNKIKSSAFKALFDEFTAKLPAEKNYEEMRIIAVDGSRLNLLYNPKDEDTYHKDIENRKGINQLHLNAMYDVMNHLFIDVEFQTVNKLNEKDAFITMLKRYSYDQNPTLFILDRGYCSYNVMANLIHSKHLFIIRATSNMINSIFGENAAAIHSAKTSDCNRTVIVGRSKKYRYLENYQLMKTGRRYDFLEDGSRETDSLTFRVAKFPLSEETDEYIITNLEADKFDIDKIKDLYFKRWGIETAFRDLKYSCGLSAIHSLKKELIKQEIYAKLTMYNYSSSTIQVAEEAVAKKEKTQKYEYCINVRKAIQKCMDYLKKFEKDLVRELQKHKTARRPGRTFQRNMSRQSSVPSCYR